MPLPSGGSLWPPIEAKLELAKMAEWSAWYGGDPEALRTIYAVGSPAGSLNQTQSARVPWYRAWTRWARNRQTQGAAILHVPVASDVSAVGASLLFAEAPIVRVPEAHEAADLEEGDVPPPASSNTAAGKAEDRLRVIWKEGGVVNRLLEAAELASPYGGVYIYPAWDVAVAPFPIMAVTPADCAIPTFRWGILTAVTFWREVFVKDSVVWRHLEVHETQSGGKAHILHGLYEGTSDNLGPQRALAVRSETFDLQPEIVLPFDELDVEYIPNSRPNRLFPKSAQGGSDYQGSEGLFDSIDETYASWMRDIRLAKARIIVPEDFLDPKGMFDTEQEVYQQLRIDPETAAKVGMVAHQFAIRWQEHQKTIDGLMIPVASNAGYSPSTFGIGITDGTQGAESGKALRIRQNRTQLTLLRKGHWWGPAIADWSEHALLIDATVFSSGVDAFRPVVKMADSIATDPSELAATAALLRSAEAASDEVLVELVHPDWGADEVAAEVARIQDQRKSSVPSPFALNTAAPVDTSPPADGATLPDAAKGAAPTSGDAKPMMNGAAPKAP